MPVLYECCLLARVVAAGLFLCFYGSGSGSGGVLGAFTSKANGHFLANRKHNLSKRIVMSSLPSSSTSPQRLCEKEGPRLVVRVASEFDERDSNIDALVELVNAAYRKGEEGILVDTPTKPFLRMTRQDVKDLLVSRQLLVLVKTDSDGAASSSSSNPDTEEALVGCIKVSRVPKFSESDACIGEETSDSSVIGEWGCLAVALQHQGKGYGRLLIQAAEKHLDSEHSCTHVQLELLSPSRWKHGHKERLRTWYTSPALGYELAVPGDYDASTQQFAAGTMLAGRFELATDADFTLYRKRLAS